MPKILLTGASGLLGVNFLLEAKGQHQITGVVNSRNLMLDGVEIIQADLLEPDTLDKLFDTVKPDWVVHTAAQANVDACEKDMPLAHFLNAEIAREVAERAQATGARLVHISTDAVFDGQQGDYKEDDETNPLSVYARTKLAGEHYVIDAYPEAMIARVNFFGWSLTGQRSLAEFFYNGLNAGVDLKGFTDVFFCPLLANDLAKLILEMLEKDLHGVYHVVSGDSLSKYDFGVQVARLFGFIPKAITPISVEEMGLAAKRSPNLTLNTDKLAAALGHSLPTVTEGLVRFFELYQQGYPNKVQSL